MTVTHAIYRAADLLDAYAEARPGHARIIHLSAARAALCDLTALLLRSSLPDDVAITAGMLTPMVAHFVHGTGAPNVPGMAGVLRMMASGMREEAEKSSPRLIDEDANAEWGVCSEVERAG